MIVMLALLNDGAILSIAYDNVLYKNKPEALRTCGSWLAISTVLGVIGVIAAFALFYLGERVFPLRPSARPDTDGTLKLSVAGHLTIFLTRTPRPFWSIRPARILWDSGCLAHRPSSNIDRGLWAIHGSPSAGSGGVRLGLRLYGASH